LIDAVPCTLAKKQRRRKQQPASPRVTNAGSDVKRRSEFAHEKKRLRAEPDRVAAASTGSAASSSLLHEGITRSADRGSFTVYEVRSRCCFAKSLPFELFD